MDQIYVDYLYGYFNKLTELYNFRINSEINEGQTYMIEFSSVEFSFKIEKYFREFYLSVYKSDDKDNSISIFNLIEYLNQGLSDTPRFKSFSGARNLDECYKKQFDYLATVISDYYTVISGFFSKDNYKSNILGFDKYWRNKYPELYRTI